MRITRTSRITRLLAASLAALTVVAGVVAVDRATAQRGGDRTRLYLEAESLLPAIESFATREVYSGAGEQKRSEGQAIARLQRNCCGVLWSSNAQVLFENTTKGNRFTLAFDVPRSRTYELRAVYTRAPDFGIFRMAVNRRPIGPSVNAYAPGSSARRGCGSAASSLRGGGTCSRSPSPARIPPRAGSSPASTM